MTSFHIVLVVLLGVSWSSPVPISNESTKRNNIQRYYEKGGFFEGDMRFNRAIQPRNGLVDEKFRWTNKTVYYSLSAQFNNDQRQIIIGALNEIESKTCIKFVPRQKEPNYVSVTAHKAGCWSYVGMLSSNQSLNLEAPDCVHHQVVMHEFLHVLGFEHQHSASNRDDYIEVHQENVMDEFKFALEKYDKLTITDFGTKYDYHSIIHYTGTAFSKNGKETIITKDPQMQNVIGHADKLSDIDIMKINLMYNCQ